MAAEPVYGPLHKSKSNGTAIILGIALVIAAATMFIVVQILLRPPQKATTVKETPPSVQGSVQTGQTASSVTISFDGNEADSGDTSPVSCKKGDRVTLPKCGFSREGYEFSNWVDEAGVEYEPGDTLIANDNLTLTAVWNVVATATPQIAKPNNPSEATLETPSVPSESLVSSFPRKWSGTYIGTSSYVEGGHITRAVAFDFTTVTDSGHLEGICYVGIEQTGPGETYGTCYITGDVDWSSGSIHFTGTDWIDQGGLGELREYSGTVDFANQAMGGSAWDVGTGNYEAPWSVRAVSEIAIWQNGSLTRV
jgi:hypothetical protein